MKGHISSQLHVETLTTMCKSVQIIARTHENVHTIIHNSNDMDIKCNGMNSNGTDMFVFFM